MELERKQLTRIHYKSKMKSKKIYSTQPKSLN